MDLWDQDAVDLVGPGTIEFSPNGTGQFRFIAVEGNLDYRITKPGNTRADFIWTGTDDGDPVSGRGWADHDTDTLHGHIYLNNGDDSGYHAKQTSP